MKCEKCGKNEVNFMYHSNVNGKVTEQHLCSRCAEELGLTQRMAAHSRQIHRLNRDFFGGSLWDDWFSPLPTLMGTAGIHEDLFEDLFAQMPVLGAGKTAPAAEQQTQPLVEEAEQQAFARTRRINALRMEQQEAIRQENFERAAQLRDEIRGLEAGGEQRL